MDKLDFGKNVLLARIDFEDLIEKEEIFGYPVSRRMGILFQEELKQENTLLESGEDFPFTPSSTVGTIHAYMLEDIHEINFGSRKINVKSSCFQDAGNAIDVLSRLLSKDHQDFEYFLDIIDDLKALYLTYDDFWDYRQGFEQEAVKTEDVINLTKKLHRSLGKSLTNKQKSLLLHHDVRWIPYIMYKSLNIVLKNEEKHHHKKSKYSILYPDSYYFDF